jgi:hypothetical protein
MTKHSLFRYFKTSPEVIRLAVMMYVRFPLLLRNVEDLLHERGVDVSHETVRFWWNRFGPMFASPHLHQPPSRSNKVFRRTANDRLQSVPFCGRNARRDLNRAYDAQGPASPNWHPGIQAVCGPRSIIVSRVGHSSAKRKLCDRTIQVANNCSWVQRQFNPV